MLALLVKQPKATYILFLGTRSSLELFLRVGNGQIKNIVILFFESAFGVYLSLAVIPPFYSARIDRRPRVGNLLDQQFQRYVQGREGMTIEICTCMKKRISTE